MAERENGTGISSRRPNRMTPLPRMFDNGSEMGRRIGEFDWSSTSLGPIETWPSNLRTVVGTVVSNGTPMLMLWGDERVQLYNDAYIPLSGDKHPGLLGSRFGDAWPEVVDVLGPVFDTVHTGEAVTLDRQFFVNRFGFLEEIFALVVSSPLIDDAGRTTGILCTVMESTDRVLGARRMRVLSDLAGSTAAARTAGAACRKAAKVLAKAAADIPFALIYLADEGRRQAYLAASAGLPPGRRGAPEWIALVEAAEPDESWPLGRIASGGESIQLDDLEARFGDLPGGEWPEPPRSALLLPLVSPTQERPVGFLVAAASPRRMLDDPYREFLKLVADQLSKAIGDVRVWNEERKRADALAELDRTKTEFFSNISHEFRTPLTLILGPIEDALAAADKALVGEDLQRVRRNALRLSKMVNALLDFSRMEAGRAQATFLPTDLAALTTDLASAFRSAVQSAGLTLTVDCPPLPEAVYVDTEMWEKIVLNLLSNAVKYTYEGEITVRLRWENGQAVLTVADTGVGIPEDELPSVFQRFYRVRGVEGRSHEGSGIGLALVNELVMLHGGSAAVESTLGRGSTFTIRLPRGTGHLPSEHVRHASKPRPSTAGAAAFVEEARRWSLSGAIEAEDTAVEARAQKPVEPMKAHILLADDNADLRTYVAGCLRRFFTRVDTVGDGRAALEAARAEPPDLLLSDVMMPGLDGFTLVRELRGDERTRAIRIVLLSARAGEEATLEGLESGADDYLVKPFSTRELIARVRTQIEMRRVRREALHREFDNERLRDTLAARDEFLSMASHELRTPLTALRLQAQAFLRGAQNDADIRRAEALLRSVERLVQLVNDLLDVSRITGGRLSLAPEEVDLTEVVIEALAKARPQAAAQGTVIESSLPGTIRGRWDRVRLEQVVAKLLGNALKYGTGKPVEVSLEEDDGNARLTVRDQGIGIPPNEQARIFERFERAVPMQHFGGLGLGLWIARQLVESMGGSIRVDSEEGRGATFTMDLPKAPMDESN